MPIAYLMHWTEFERGWGQRPDGYSLHASPEAWTEYLTKYRASQSREVPDEYSAPGDKLVAVEITPELAERLAQEPSIRFWNSQLVVSESVTGTRTVSEKTPTPPPTFVDLCLSKKAKPEDIDDFIDRWHEGKAGVGKELREYLGMNKVEYALFIQDSANLHKILFERFQSAS